jgi:hypothetical protein
MRRSRQRRTSPRRHQVAPRRPAGMDQRAERPMGFLARATDAMRATCARWRRRARWRRGVDSSGVASSGVRAVAPTRGWRSALGALALRSSERDARGRSERHSGPKRSRSRPTACAQLSKRRMATDSCAGAEALSALAVRSFKSSLLWLPWLLSSMVIPWYPSQASPRRDGAAWTSGPCVVPVWFRHGVYRRSGHCARCSRPLSTTLDHSRPLSTTLDHSRPLSTTLDHSRPMRTPARGS